MPVPVASYDVRKSAWIPTQSTEIIKVVGNSGGIASISVLPSGAVAGSATLAALGIGTAERQSLTGLYSVGQELWRMPVTHFCQ
jgi:hypothetical protein